MMGLINFYKTIRSIAGNIKFDAAINPVYANSFIRSENFLDLILQHINTISIMSYRKGIDRAIQWALPTIEIAEKNDAFAGLSGSIASDVSVSFKIILGFSCAKIEVNPKNKNSRIW